MQRWIWTTTVIVALLIAVGYGWHHPQKDSIAEPLTIAKAIPPLTTSAPVADVVIQNNGNTTIDLTQISTSCSCSVPEVSLPLRIPPRKVARFPVRGNPPAYGEKTVDVSIYTNIAAQKIVRVPLKLLGEELHPPYVIPQHSELHWRVIGHQKAVTNSMRIHTIEFASTEPWLKAVRSSVPDVEISSIAIIEKKKWTHTAEERIYELEIRFPESQTPRKSIITGELLLDVTSPPSQPIPLHHFVLESRSMLAVQPESLFIMADDDSPSGRIERNVRVWRRDGKRPKLRPAKISSEWLTIEEVIDSSQDLVLNYLILVRNSSATKGRVSSTIQFEDEEGYSVELPVMARFE